MITFTDSVYLNLDVAFPDANSTYQWSGSLPVMPTEGQGTIADILGLTPNAPQPYSVILTVLNADGSQVDQSSKQLTVTYEPIDAIEFMPQGPLVFMDNNEVLDLRQHLHDEGYYLKGLPHDAHFSPTLCTSLTDGSGSDATAVYSPVNNDHLTCLMPIGTYPDMNSAVQYSIDADVTATIGVEVGAPMDQITAIAFVDQSNNPVTNYQVDTGQSVFLSSPSETPVMITQINSQSATPGNYVNMDCTFTVSGAGTLMGSAGNYTYQAPLSASQDTVVCNIAKGTIIVVDGANHEVDPNNDLNVQVMMDVAQPYIPLHTFAYNAQNYQVSNAGNNNVTWFEARATCEGWNSLSADNQTAAINAGLSAANFSAPLDEDSVGWFLPDKDFLVGTTAEWGDKLPNGATRFWSKTELDLVNAYHIKSDATEGSRDKSAPSTAIGFRCLRQVP